MCAFLFIGCPSIIFVRFYLLGVQILKFNRESLFWVSIWLAAKLAYHPSSLTKRNNTDKRRNSVPQYILNIPFDWSIGSLQLPISSENTLKNCALKHDNRALQHSPMQGARLHPTMTSSIASRKSFLRRLSAREEINSSEKRHKYHHLSTHK